MREIIKGVFSYQERFIEKQVTLLPDTLKLDQKMTETIIYRLLLGTLSIKVKGYEKEIVQDINYAILSYQRRDKKLTVKNIFDSNVPLKDNYPDFNKYMKQSRKNTPVYDKILAEISNYFYQKDKEAYISAFIHLYRSIEYLSYAFPLVYASKSRDYMKSYNHLKAFFSEEQKSELKFFNIFLNTCIESSINDINFDIIIDAPTEEIRNEILKIINQFFSEKIETMDYDRFKIKFKDVLDMTVIIRNRFFHMSSTNDKNITGYNILMDYLFKSINDSILNFIAVIYFEITKYGLEQI